MFDDDEMSTGSVPPPRSMTDAEDQFCVMLSKRLWPPNDMSFVGVDRKYVVERLRERFGPGTLKHRRRGGYEWHQQRGSRQQI